MQRCKHPTPSSSRGFIVAYLLFGIALLALVTTVMVNFSQFRSTERVLAERRDQIVSDALMIRTALLNCATLFPAGKNGDPNTGLPAFPKTGNGKISDLTCPGTQLSPTQPEKTIWKTLTDSGYVHSSHFAYRIGMSDWMYENSSANGVYFYIQTTGADDINRNVLRSVTRNRRLNTRTGSSPEDVTQLFYTEAVTSGGQQVTRLRSRDFRLP